MFDIDKYMPTNKKKANHFVCNRVFEQLSTIDLEPRALGVFALGTELSTTQVKLSSARKKANVSTPRKVL